MLLCLHRARFCELLAPIAGQAAAEQYLIGLLSVLDAMLNVSMKQVLPMLPLRPAAAAVLLGEPSPIDLPLRLIRYYEQSQWEVCAVACRTLGITEAELTNLYLESLRWANQQIHNFVRSRRSSSTELQRIGTPNSARKNLLLLPRRLPIVSSSQSCFLASPDRSLHPPSRPRPGLLGGLPWRRRQCPPAAPPTRFVGRQPILDPDQKVFGYELLFRTGWENSFSGDPESVGQQMIDNALVFGMDTLVHGARAFVKCTRETLTSRYATCLPAPIPSSRFPPPSPSIARSSPPAVSSSSSATRSPWTTFSPGSNVLVFDLFYIADFIKLELRAWQTAPPIVRNALLNSHIARIAKKIETAEQFLQARDEGYEFFQGYFFAHPTVLTSQEIPSNPLIYIKLLAAMDRTPPDRDEIERLVSAEASLCLRLLRLVNSVEFGARDRVSSIRQALLMVGEAKFRKLVTIAAATSLKTNPTQSPELMLLCLHRARFCELLAAFAKLSPGEQYLIGLLSVVNAMLNISMEKLLKMLPLPPSTTSALLGEPCAIDLPLRLILRYEQNDWAGCASYCETLGISEAQLTNTYLDALQWANQQILEGAE